MPVILYQQRTTKQNGFEQFLIALRSSQLDYLASDLLAKGLNPSDLTEAVQRAMTICRTTNREVANHFLPVYSSYRGQLVNDCKLSSLGYALVLMNARANNQTVAEWQLELLEQAFAI